VGSQVTGQAYLGPQCPLAAKEWYGGHSVWVSSTGFAVLMLLIIGDQRYNQIEAIEF